MPLVEESSDDIGNLMSLAYMISRIIVPLGGGVLREQCASMILYLVFG